MKKLIFFLIASAILIFSIIIVNIAPIINGKINSDTWFTQSCGQLSDNYKYNKEQTNDEDILKPLRKKKDRCYRKQAMYGLEYTTSNLNIIFGFVCALLGFLLFLNLVNIGKYIGLIGLGTGCIGFVLTFVYVIESGLVFNDIIDSSSALRIDSDGAILEWNESKKRYTCIFYEEDNEDSLLLKYSDLGNKYLSYNKDFYYAENEKNYKYLDQNGCIYSSRITREQCKDLKELDGNRLTNLNAKQSYYDSSSSTSNKQGECDRLFYISKTSSNKSEQIYNSWLTTIIFSCFIFLLYIALAIFGFLVFRESGGSSGQVAIK